MREERGFALIITLIVTALLVTLLVEFVSEVYVDTSHSHNFVASQQAGLLAESGITGGIKLLQVSATLRQGAAYSSLLEPWAQPQVYDTGDGTVSISIEEESGKLDLNALVSQTGVPNDVYTKTFKRLLVQLKLAPELYEAVVDWVDSDTSPLTNGAETNSYYSKLKTPYQAHDNRFETFEELALVRGFTPEVINKLRACVTVYGSETGIDLAKININTAPKELLAALHDEFMRGDQVERILETRKARPIDALAKVPGLERMIDLASNATCKGKIYRIRAEGKVGESVSVAEAVVTNVDAAKPTVLYWREY